MSSGGCILGMALFLSGAEAAEVSIEVTGRGLRPDHVVLQTGDSVKFIPSIDVGIPPTVALVGEAKEIEVEHRIEGDSWTHHFGESGIFEILVREQPSVRGRAIVFSRGSVDSDLRQERVSYSIGYDLGQTMARRVENLNLELFNAGIEHAYRGQEPKLSPEEMDFIVKEYGREVARLARDDRERIAARNLRVSREFLERNARQPEVVVLPSGLQYEILEQGAGLRPKLGSRVKVHHRATLLDGTEFDNTYEKAPAEFVLTESVLPGYSEGLKLMSEGSRWRLFVPPQLAYGIRGQASVPGAPPIEPNATLVFEVELLAVGPGSSAAPD